jgi:hypothetical protein
VLTTTSKQRPPVNNGQFDTATASLNLTFIRPTVYWQRKEHKRKKETVQSNDQPESPAHIYSAKLNSHFKSTSLPVVPNLF